MSQKDRHIGSKTNTPASVGKMSLSTLTAMTGVLSQRTFWHITALVRWGVNSKINDGWIPFGCSTLTVLTLFMPLFLTACVIVLFWTGSQTHRMFLFTVGISQVSLTRFTWSGPKTGESCENIQVLLVLPKTVKALQKKIWFVGRESFCFVCLFFTWKV